MRRLILMLLLSFSFSAWAQQTSLQGLVLNAINSEPMGNVSVQIDALGVETKTDMNGAFLINDIAPGSYSLALSSPSITTVQYPVEVIANKANDIGTIYVSANLRGLLNEGSIILIEEEEMGNEEEMGDFNISSLMISSNDTYISNASYNFSTLRFRLRGYENRYSDAYINGIRFNDAERGGFSYGLIGGLNDATRNKDVANYNSASNYSFGQIGGSSNINTNASNYAPGTRAGLAYTNRNYNLRATATISTGLMDNGWAFTGSLGYRWADEGFVDGTFYNSLGYLFAAEKVINPKHSISFTTFGSPTQRAQQSPNTQEAVDLTGDTQYNSYWGWQDGEKRNSRIVTVFEPAAILSHKFQIEKDTRLTTSLGYKYTLYGSTALGWTDAMDPRPDYYKNFPSYFAQDDVNSIYRDKWERDGVAQVDWAYMYGHNIGNKGDKAKDAGSSYIVEERHNNQQMLSLNSIINTKLNEKITLVAGVEGSMTKGMHYKTINDLLGGEFYKDIDSFAERDWRNSTTDISQDIYQNDLRNPNRLVKEGDRFGYDYNIYVNSANAWLQNTHRYRNFDLNYGFKIDYTSFYRDGKMQNGRAPENSYGKGKTHEFITQSTKLGLTYKPNGIHIFSGNISYSTLPPLADNSYISVRIKDDAVPDLKAERVFSADLSYNLTTPIFKGRVSVFQTNFYDQVKRYSFYYDTGEGSGSLLNYVLSGMNKMYQGIELGIEAKINSIFTASFAGTIADYIYTNRPTAYASYENGLGEEFSETVYLKNYHVGGTPQIAGTLGLHAFYDYWFLDVNLNGFDDNYIDLAPNRRTVRAVSYITESESEWREGVKDILHQEKMDGGFTLDVSIGKSLRLNRKYTLNINCQFKNVLNNTDLKTGGFEQSRFDYENSDVTKFPSKYYYAQGFNMFLNVGLRF